MSETRIQQQYDWDNQYRYDPTKNTTPHKKELDRDAFLKILMMQLQYQDPSQPMQDKDFIAQMAQFSSLEQMNKVSEAMNKTAVINSMTLGANLLGNTVSYLGEDGTLKTGQVTGVKKVDGVVMAQVGDALIDLSALESISNS